MDPRPAFILILAAALPSHAVAQQPVTARNWRHHPSIRAIRGLAAATDAAIKDGELRAQTDSAECHGGEESVTAHLFTDSSGHVRKYVLTGGSEDSAGEVWYYYDLRGRLRFTFESLRAVDGTARETRVYFDSAGVQLYKDVRLLKGPGHPGGFDLVLTDPVADFHSLCGAPNEPPH